MAADPLTLRTALGRTPRTRALYTGAVGSARLTLELADIPTINRAFAPMVREARFDVCEIAIATALQALAYGKPLVLLPVVMAARYQETALLCRAGGPVGEPADLVGRRIGVRAYSQTTGMWLRGILEEAHGVAPAQVRWITFEDAHVAEYRDPPWAERAPAGADMLDMLRAGALDAAIVGNEVPNDPTLRTVFTDPEAAAQEFRGRHHLVPVNHIACLRRELAERHPWLIGELLRIFDAAADAVEGARLPFGRASLDPAIRLALRYSASQGLLPRALMLDEVWQGLGDEA